MFSKEQQIELIEGLLSQIEQGQNRNVFIDGLCGLVVDGVQRGNMYWGMENTLKMLYFLFDEYHSECSTFYDPFGEIRTDPNRDSGYRWYPKDWESRKNWLDQTLKILKSQ